MAPLVKEMKMSSSHLHIYEDQYIAALTESRFEDAKQHLLSAISIAKNVDADARPVLAGLAQRLGSILLQQGDKLSAIALHELSEVLDPDSLLAKLDYAKFLLKEVGDKNAAKEKSKEIIALARANPFPGDDEDFSSDEYIDAAGRVISESSDQE